MIDLNSIILSDKKDDSEYNFNGNKFYSSSFNTIWFSELGIEPKIILDIGSYDFGDSIRYKLEFPNSSVYDLLEKMGYHLLKDFNVDKLYIYKN